MADPKASPKNTTKRPRASSSDTLLDPATTQPEEDDEWMTLLTEPLCEGDVPLWAAPSSGESLPADLVVPDPPVQHSPVASPDDRFEDESAARLHIDLKDRQGIFIRKDDSHDVLNGLSDMQNHSYLVNRHFGVMDPMLYVVPTTKARRQYLPKGREHPMVTTLVDSTSLRSGKKIEEIERKAMGVIAKYPLSHFKFGFAKNPVWRMELYNGQAGYDHMYLLSVEEDPHCVCLLEAFCIRLLGKDSDRCDNVALGGEMPPPSHDGLPWFLYFVVKHPDKANIKVQQKKQQNK